MEEWKEYKIGEIVQTNVAQYSLSENWPLIHYLDTGSITKNQISNITLYSGNTDLPSRARRKVKDGDIVFSAVRPNLCHYGYMDNPPSNLLVSTGFVVITVNAKIADPRFLYYYLTQNEIVDHLHAIGEQAVSTYPTIRPSDIENLSVPLPPLSEQKKISSILYSLDSKISCNRRINDNLPYLIQLMALIILLLLKRINDNLLLQTQALFKSWFVEYSPFKDGGFVESELGMIPKGWKVGNFIDCINVMPGGTPSTSIEAYWKDGDIPFFSPKDVDGVYCFDTEKHITKDGLDHCNSHLYPKDTLFITARGTVGKIALAGLPMAMNQSNYALVAKEGVGKYYLFLLCQTLVQALLKKANGAVFSAITTKDFNEAVVIPTSEAMKEFEETAEPLFEKIHVTAKETRRLAQVRDEILPQLMSGELKVNELTL